MPVMKARIRRCQTSCQVPRPTVVLWLVLGVAYKLLRDQRVGHFHRWMRRKTHWRCVKGVLPDPAMRPRVGC